MEAIVLAKILNAHNVVFFILSTLIAMAIVNKTKIPNRYIPWAILASWIALAVLFAILGGLFRFVIVPLLIVGIIAVAWMYLKKYLKREAK
ncbi:MAG: hypothetical protein Q8N63_03000 [Nanoarchaeota archaeon]|nr:hypothetical protein [Nanoarchaeota archaeon]